MYFHKTSEYYHNGFSYIYFLIWTIKWNIHIVLVNYYAAIIKKLIHFKKYIISFVKSMFYIHTYKLGRATVAFSQLGSGKLEQVVKWSTPPRWSEFRLG